MLTTEQGAAQRDLSVRIVHMSSHLTSHRNHTHTTHHTHPVAPIDAHHNIPPDAPLGLSVSAPSSLTKPHDTTTPEPQPTFRQIVEAVLESSKEEGGVCFATQLLGQAGKAHCAGVATCVLVVLDKGVGLGDVIQAIEVRGVCVCVCVWH